MPDLDTVVHYSSADLLEYAPITSRFVDSERSMYDRLDDPVADGTLTDADFGRYFKDARLDTHVDAVRTDRPRPGVRIDWDHFGVPHVDGRTAADVGFGAGWSVAESRLAYLLRRAGLPAPTPQFEVRDGGRVIFRLDFAWPEYGVYIEMDGKAKYTSLLRPGETGADVLWREKRRQDRALEITGWRCLRLTWADLENPQRTAARIRAFLARAA